MIVKEIYYKKNEKEENEKKENKRIREIKNKNKSHYSYCL